MGRKYLIINSLLIIVITCTSWGFFAHQRINRLAVFTLPDGLIGFYKSNINYITEHATDPDKRRYADSSEAPRHFIDADYYGIAPFDSIPEKYSDAAAKYSEDILKAHGIIPWHIEKTYYALVKAFRNHNSSGIISLSADLGHYVSDAHVPLHTTENYNGQLTNQTGIHAFWESRLPELFSAEYDYFTRPAQYIDNPLQTAWKIIRNTYSCKDSVLQIEARLNAAYPSDQKYTFSKRNGKVTKQYSEDYSRAYHDAMKGMVERQMRASVAAVGSYWFSAWVDAGQPAMRNMRQPAVSVKEDQSEREDNHYKQGHIIGRPED